MSWGGGSTFSWFIDRENGLCGVGAVQAALPFDADTVAQLKDTFRHDIYRKPSAAVGTDLPKGDFEIGVWCGIPADFLSVDRVREMAAAGFTLASNGCDAGSRGNATYNRILLDIARDVGSGMAAWVWDSRASAAAQGESVDANLDAVVAAYASAPALAGYYLFDEPNAAMFSKLAVAAQGLLKRDPKHFPFINMLPYGCAPATYGAPSYDEYISQFLQTVRPPLWSYDQYVFLSSGTASPFPNLAIARKNSLQYGSPFWQYIQSIAYASHRDPNAAEKSWAAFHALAYGATGVGYFTYWTPPQTGEQFQDAIITRDGRQTHHYAEVRSINLKLGAFGKFTAAAKSATVWHNGGLMEGATPRVPFDPLYVPGLAPFTVGTFDVASSVSSGGKLVVVVNRDFTQTISSDVLVACSNGLIPESFNAASQQWVPLSVVARSDSFVKVHLALSAGDAMLLHIPGPVPKGPAGAEAYVGLVRSDAGSLYVVDSTFGAQFLAGFGWNDPCSEGYTLAGKLFESNGFAACIRSDLASNSTTLWLGNVVNNRGMFYSAKAGTATYVGDQPWNYCPAGTHLLGRVFNDNGFWVCA